MKKFLSIVLAGAMVLAMAGCSGGNSSSGQESSQTDSAAVSDGGSTAQSTAESGAETGAESGASLPVAMKSDLLSQALQSSLGLDQAAADQAAQDMLPLLMYNEGNPARIAKVIKKLQAGEDVTVAFLGGSITQGTGADNESCYAALTAKWIQAQFPEAKVNYVNAGIGATGSYIGVHRCDEQVLSHDPDLVFIDFSVNDESQNNAINKLTYEGLIRKIWKHSTNPGIICVAMTQDNGTSVQECHGEVAAKYSVPLVSYHDAMLNFLNTNSSGKVWADISGDNIHPNYAGHAVLSAMLTTYLQYITDNVDSIDETDPELAAPGDSGEKYENARMLTVEQAQPVSAGAFEKKSMTFGGFDDPWIARTSDGTYGDDAALVVEVEAQSIGFLYGKLTSKAGLADIYIDDDFVTTLNADFSGGWGNYVQFTEVKSFMTSGKHTLKIVPKGVPGESSAFYISAITLA